MIYSRIAGTGGYLPERILTNADLEKQIETTDAWITERTGIKKRHIAADSDTSASMGAEAAKAALAMAGKSADEVDLIIVGTCTPDRIFPSTACLIQARLGIERSIPAFDVSAACSAFLYGLSIADQYIKTGVVRSALVIGSEVLSRVVNWQDRSTCILFGDGAGAVLLEASETPGILSTHLHARGQYQDLLYLANPRLAPIMPYGTEFVNMRGNEVFKIAVTELGNCVTEAIEANGLVKSDIDWLIPHQANVRIIQSLAKRLDLSFDKVVLTLADQGNTSAASIPLALDVAVRDGRIQRGQYLLFDAIGGGMAWGSALVVF